MTPAHYRLTGCGTHTLTTACPHHLTLWLESHGLSRRAARLLATETLLRGWAGWERVQLERT
ncbi:hypothetical protein DEIPH_ctg011orf0050 [Deinococcus phoenicis]|uniref:Uncharacterized protein n=1 Tax=Deinococcus phoenicis TaxID=1476583 RepID=A0A016QT99_9DEIO|nr:hypothetical protein [Deinococcus phoenicis]EYB69082.1 hypothetical protein DEIPH_ctg011orf0050 [Deinococcus phoenicis]